MGTGRDLGSVSVTMCSLTVVEVVGAAVVVVVVCDTVVVVVVGFLVVVVLTVVVDVVVVGCGWWNGSSVVVEVVVVGVVVVVVGFGVVLGGGLVGRPNISVIPHSTFIGLFAELKQAMIKFTKDVTPTSENRNFTLINITGVTLVGTSLPGSPQLETLMYRVVAGDRCLFHGDLHEKLRLKLTETQGVTELNSR